MLGGRRPSKDEPARAGEIPALLDEVGNYFELVHDTFDDGTGPSTVGGLKLQLTVSCTLPPWTTLRVALVKDRSIIVSVQFLPLGQSGAWGIGFGLGPSVVTSNVVPPFVMSLAGLDCEPVTWTAAGL